MHRTGLLLVLLLIPLGSAQIETSTSQDYASILGIGVFRNDALAVHQDIELRWAIGDYAYRSGTMHDHEGFFWSLSQWPAGELVGDVVQRDGSHAFEHRTGANQVSEVPDAGLSFQDGALSVTTSETARLFWRLVEPDGRLVAWSSTLAAAGTSQVATYDFENLDDLRVEADLLYLGGAVPLVANHASSPAPEANPLQPVLDLLPQEDPEPRAGLPTCTDLRMEPEVWYTDTHIRLSAVPDEGLSQILASGTYHLVEVTAEGFVERVLQGVMDPFAHTVVRAPEAGTYMVERRGFQLEDCAVEVEVRPSEGRTDGLTTVEAFPGRIELFFDTETTSHYDVDAIVRATEGRLVFAGKIHSHSMGTGATIQVPAGEYEVQLFPVAQGPGPRVDPVVQVVTVPALVQDQEASAVPILLPVLALVCLARIRRT